MAEAERVRAVYDRAAERYDRVAHTKLLEGMRERLLALAHGDVLELGVGTGATFGHYPPGVRGLTGLDVSGEMLAAALDRSQRLPFPVWLRQLDFQDLPFESNRFDTVVSSLALCGVPDPPGLFAQLRRVLRPGGQLLALEHVRPPQPLLARTADLIDPLFDHVVGCHPNRPTVRLLRDAGFRVEVLERQLGGILVSVRAALPAGTT